MWIKILFIITVLLNGCTTTKGKITQAPVAKQEKIKILDDVLVFRDLQQVDLDKDGAKEIVAVYNRGVNLTGVKVIKFKDDRGNIIFEHIFDTPNVKFELRDGIPTIVSTAAGFKRIYHWDGQTFNLKEEKK